MVKVLLGVFLGMVVTSFAVEKREDGSVTFTRDEIETITANWYSMDYALKTAAERIRTLENELRQATFHKCS